MTNDQDNMPAGRTIEDRFVLAEEVGRGRMSTVYLARDRANDGLNVAVKVLDTAHADSLKREFFARETTALRRLRHPNIVGLREGGWWNEEGAFYIVLDHHPHSLDRWLQGQPAPPEFELDPVRVMRELADALAHAHSEGVVHRDIKPSNILLDQTGHALLTDFGISKVVSHLTVGETLAGYWSSGYASPEQQASRHATFASDVYSLGAVFYHMLSGREPPPQGPGRPLVEDMVDRPFRRALLKMLDERPEERPSAGAQLMSALDATRNHESLPMYPVLLTHAALGDLRNAGHIERDTPSETRQFLHEELGGDEVEEVCIVSRLRNGERDVIVLGDSVQLVCAVAEAGDALVCKAVQTPYDPILQRAKQQALRRRALWTVGHPQQTASDTPGNRRDLQALLEELAAFESAGAASREHATNGTRAFIEDWRRALRETRVQIETQGATLRYTDRHVDRDYIRFELQRPPPDDLDWRDDTPLAAKENRHSPPVQIGNLVEIRGRTVVVAREFHGPRPGRTEVPPNGHLAVNTREALTEVGRRQRAVNAFLFDQMANPALAAAILSPSTRSRSSVPDLAFFQSRLSEDKRAVVRRAVSTNDIFLIQGPPGTGKTSVIAETVLQILHRNPAARILLSSQSNVAVDHALTRIAEVAGETPPQMVRIGRAERIGHGGERWILAERTRVWGEKVLSHLEPVEDALRNEERVARRAVKDANRAEAAHAESGADLEDWIAEANDIAEQLREYEDEYAMLGEDTGTANRADVSQLVDEARRQLRDHLGALNELLPHQTVDLSQQSEEDALRSITDAAATLQKPQDAESTEVGELIRVQEMRRILKHWKKVVGRGRDFEDLVAKSARVVAATCSISAKLNPRNAMSDASFDWAVVDEAGRATVPEVLIPIGMAQRVILVGDERQLPPMVDENIGRSRKDQASTAFDTSLFQNLLEQEGGDRKHIARLQTQYRMHPAIGNLVSAVFYDGTLVNGDPDRVHTFAASFPSAVNWLSTSRQPDRAESRSGDSYENPAEAATVLAVLARIARDPGRRTRLRVGIISGYSGQVGRLRGAIDTSDTERWPGLSIDIATVDSFQGRECDVVIYSTVRSNTRRRIGFLRDHRRLNVALSRARDLLIIVGDDYMMENVDIGTAGNPFADVLSHVRSNPDECRVVDARSIS